MKRVLILLFFLMGMGAGTARAVTPLPLAWCNGCTEAQMADKSRFAGALGTVYVGDLNSRIVRAYNVFKNIIGYDEYGNPIWGAKQSTPVPTSPVYVESANKLMNFYYAAPAGWQKSKEITYPGGIYNVWNVVNKGYFQNNFLDALEGLPDIASEINSYRIDGALKINTPPTVIVTIKFSDGTKIKVKIDMTTNPPQLSVIDDSGRDNKGNTVLTRPITDRIEFELDFADANTISNWANHMTAIGYSGASARRGSWACTSSPAGFHCVYMSQ